MLISFSSHTCVRQVRRQWLQCIRHINLFGHSIYDLPLWLNSELTLGNRNEVACFLVPKTAFRRNLLFRPPGYKKSRNFFGFLWWHRYNTPALKFCRAFSLYTNTLPSHVGGQGLLYSTVLAIRFQEKCHSRHPDCEDAGNIQCCGILVYHLVLDYHSSHTHSTTPRISHYWYISIISIVYIVRVHSVSIVSQRSPHFVFCWCASAVLD